MRPRWQFWQALLRRKGSQIESLCHVGASDTDMELLAEFGPANPESICIFRGTLLRLRSFMRAQLSTPTSAEAQG
jgi:hypothetical protein